MADLQQLEESIVGLSLLDAAQLVKKLEERLGVSAAAAAPVMVAGGGGAAAAAPAGEKTEFAVVMTGEGTEAAQNGFSNCPAGGGTGNKAYWRGKDTT